MSTFCDICHITYKTNKDLDKHYLSDSHIENETLNADTYCILCQKTYASLKGKEKHYSSNIHMDNETNMSSALLNSDLNIDSHLYLRFLKYQIKNLTQQLENAKTEDNTVMNSYITANNQFDKENTKL